MQASFTLLEDPPLCDSADVLSTRDATHRRRRCEWPVLDLPLLNRMRRGPLRPVSPDLKERAKGVVRAAAAGCDFDGGILGNVEFLLESRVQLLLECLYREVGSSLQYWIYS